MHKTFIGQIGITLITLLLCLTSGCDTSDDVNEIFVSGKWYFLNYYTRADWDRRSGIEKYKSMVPEEAEQKKIIQRFSIQFLANGTLEGTLQDSKFTGKWNADGKSHKFHITLTDKGNTNLYLNKEFIETLSEVAYYQGDSQYIMLAPNDKRSYMQFTHGNK